MRRAKNFERRLTDLLDQIERVGIGVHDLDLLNAGRREDLERLRGVLED